jgi:hypothetical protein
MQGNLSRSIRESGYAARHVQYFGRKPVCLSDCVGNLRHAAGELLHAKRGALHIVCDICAEWLCCSTEDATAVVKRAMSSVTALID